jgi:hypothetical protein
MDSATGNLRSTLCIFGRTRTFTLAENLGQDGYFNPNLVSDQPSGAVLLKRLIVL